MDDKWCGRPFRWQRDEIIDFIEEKAIERVVFLVGDMHCAYHASMSIWAPPVDASDDSRVGRRPDQPARPRSTSAIRRRGEPLDAESATPLTKSGCISSTATPVPSCTFE